MITLNFDEVLERTYNAKKGVDVRYGLGQGFEYCKQFADEAQSHATNAKASEKKATDAVAGIEQTKTDAVQAVQQAQSTATTAVTTKQTEAVQAIGTAQTGAVKAVDDERDAALQQVADSTQAAKTAASNAAASAQAAQASKEAAATSAGAAESSATAASGSASAAATSESNAESSAQSSKTDADRAEAAAELAGTRANTDKTLSTENAPADAAAVGDIILDRTKETPQPIFYSKAEVDAKIKEAIAAALSERDERDHDVGSFYASDNPTSPAQKYGGTWEQIKDRFILAAGDTYAAGSTGGEGKTVLTAEQLPPHSHAGITVDGAFYFGWEGGNMEGVDFLNFMNSQFWSKAVRNKLSVGTTGSGEAHNNMPPYLTAYIWRRIA